MTDIEMPAGSACHKIKGNQWRMMRLAHITLRLADITIQILNRIFWLVSIGLWLWIVIRSGIWSEDFASKVFWVNFLLFLAAGIGTVATTHFAASSLPLLLGVMVVTAHDVKASVVWVGLYVAAAIAIGFFWGLIKLSTRSNDASAPADRDS